MRDYHTEVLIAELRLGGENKLPDSTKEDRPVSEPRACTKCHLLCSVRFHDVKYILFQGQSSQWHTQESIQPDERTLS